MNPAPIATFTSVLTAVGGLLVTVFGYIGYQNRRARLTAIQQVFNDAIDSLAADDEKRRLAGAILLRRFFDERSELGLRTLMPFGRRAPYAFEAVSVIAAVLRDLEGGNFQKLLADGLAYAPDLKGADLQKTNLQNAYLVPRREGASLERADFYRADLSGASLKSASARGAVFYQARLSHAVFKDADLRSANFYQADLSGARFDGAILTGAGFEGARSVPQEVLSYLNRENIYDSDEPAPRREDTQDDRRNVFLSAPSRRSLEQQLFIDRFIDSLEWHGLVAEQLNRSEYPRSGQLGEVRRRMSGCCGVVVFGFVRSPDVDDELPGAGTDLSAKRSSQLATRWNDAEAGMAFVLELPLLIFAPDSLNEGIFDKQISEHSVYRLPLSSDIFNDPERTLFREWVATVSERFPRCS